MAYDKFDPAKLDRLNDPGRFETLKPEAMWEALGSPEPVTIVEIGAGTGLFSAKFAELAPLASVYAVDMSELMLNWMRRNRDEVITGRIVPLLGEERRVPLENAVADLVAMVNLHHELADPPAIYAEALRVTRRGGQLLAVDWDRVETPRGPSMEVRVSAKEAMRVAVAAGWSSVVSHSTLPWSWMITATRP